MAQQNFGNTLTSEYQKSEPFLWFHIALLAGVPLTLIIGMLGLGVGDPVFSEWFEILVLGLPAIASPIILQWWKPLSPFSLWLFAKPLELTDESERRILAVVKDFKTVLVAIALGVVIDAIFYKIYGAAPLVADVLPLPAGLRILGVIWWSAFFLISNLLLQAGAVAIRVLLLSEADLNKLTPLPLEAISSAFTSIGKRSPQLLNFAPDAPVITKVTLEPKAKTEDKIKPKPKTEAVPEVPKSEEAIITEKAENKAGSEAPSVPAEALSIDSPEVNIPEPLESKSEDLEQQDLIITEEVTIKTEVITIPVEKTIEKSPEDLPKALDEDIVLTITETVTETISSAQIEPTIVSPETSNPGTNA